MLKTKYLQFLPFLLAILSGVMVSLPVNVRYVSILLVVAFVPLLYAEHLVACSGFKRKMLATAAVGFLFMYTFQWLGEHPLRLQFSWWKYHLYFFFISLIFVALFTLFSLVRRRLGNKLGYLAFVCLYLCFEYLLLNTNEVTFPVLMLGNILVGIGGFGIRYIQWYEYTGVLGGALWILTCNVLFFTLIRNHVEKQRQTPSLVASAIAAFVLPLTISLVIFATYQEKKAPVEFVVVQPNYNPYTEKFTVPMADQRDRMINLAESAITDHTDFVVFPETALDSNFWYNNIEDNGMVQYLRDSFLAKHDGVELITGVPMMQYFRTDVPPSVDALPAGDGIFIQMYNAAMLLGPKNINIYKKNIPVPFTERMPFVSIFPFLARINKDMYRINNALGEEQNLLRSSKARIGCAICYEAIYGWYCKNFVRQGAEVFCSVANDGWWLKTVFMYGHLRAVQVRAVENRRSIVRSDNTGFTVGIDQCGRIVAQAPWWEPTAINVTLNKNKTKTLYTQLGDYVGLISVLLAVLILILTIFKSVASPRRKS